MGSKKTISYLNIYHKNNVQINYGIVIVQSILIA